MICASLPGVGLHGGKVTVASCLLIREKISVLGKRTKIQEKGKTRTPSCSHYLWQCLFPAY